MGWAAGYTDSHSTSIKDGPFVQEGRVTWRFHLIAAKPNHISSALTPLIPVNILFLDLSHDPCDTGAVLLLVIFTHQQFSISKNSIPCHHPPLAPFSPLCFSPC